MAEPRRMIDHAVTMLCSSCGYTEVVLQRLAEGHAPPNKIIIQSHDCPRCKHAARLARGEWFPSFKGERKE